MNLPEVKIKKNVLDKIIYQSKSIDLLVFGVEAGIFEVIGCEGMLFTEVADELNFKPDITEALLNIYVSLGLMEKYEFSYVLSSESQEYLLKASPLYQGDVLAMNCKHRNILNDLPQLIKGETPQPSPKMWLDKDMIKQMAQHALAGMVQNTTEFITSIEDFKNYSRMCDLGGNHGTYSMALIDKNNLHSNIVDLPKMKPAIEEYVVQQGYENKISVIGLDINGIDTLNKKYNLVLASNVLRLWRQDLELLFEKINKILDIGGIFVSNHFQELNENSSNLTCSCHELFSRLRGFY